MAHVVFDAVRQRAVQDRHLLVDPRDPDIQSSSARLDYGMEKLQSRATNSKIRQRRRLGTPSRIEVWSLAVEGRKSRPAASSRSPPSRVACPKSARSRTSARRRRERLPGSRCESGTLPCVPAGLSPGRGGQGELQGGP